MSEYEFTLRFELPDVEASIDSIVERLAEAGCDDATIGVGIPGRLALMFTREAETAERAVLSALRDVRSVLPDALLVEATPDFVEISEVASIVGKTRQNIYKILSSSKSAGPAPVHEGSSSLWHLAPVLAWLRDERGYPIDEDMIELAQVNMEVNFAAQETILGDQVDDGIRALVSQGRDK